VVLVTVSKNHSNNLESQKMLQDFAGRWLLRLI